MSSLGLVRLSATDDEFTIASRGRWILTKGEKKFMLRHETGFSHLERMVNTYALPGTETTLFEYMEQWGSQNDRY